MSQSQNKSMEGSEVEDPQPSENTTEPEENISVTRNPPRTNLKISYDELRPLMQKLLELDGDLTSALSALHEENELLRIENTPEIRKKVKARIRGIVLKKTAQHKRRKYPRKDKANGLTRAEWNEQENQILADYDECVRLGKELEGIEIIIDSEATANGEELDQEIDEDAERRRQVAEQIQRIRNAPLQKLTDCFYKVSKMNTKTLKRVHNMSKQLHKILKAQEYLVELKARKLQMELGMEITGIPNPSAENQELDELNEIIVTPILSDYQQ
jgi:hypothetical protein